MEGQLVGDCVAGRGGPVVDVDFAVDRAEVGIDGAGLSRSRCAMSSVVTLAEQAEDFCFPVGEIAGVVAGCRGWAGKPDRAGMLEVQSSKREGEYVDPRAGRIKFRQRAENWIKGQSPDRATREVLRSRLDSQIYPHFGELPINSIKSATVRDWLGVLEENKLGLCRATC